MQIRVSTGNCRIAVGAAIVALQGKITATREKLWNQSFQALLDGAEHNGLDVNEARKAEMRGMVDRDLDHMMEKHPAYETLQVLNNFVDMLAYHQGADIVIDDQDFRLLKEHLPHVDVTQDPKALAELIGSF